MTNASIALLKISGREPTAVNPRMLARANLRFVESFPEPTSVAKPLLPAKVLVARLRDGGLPVACLADILAVERKTVYAWLDGAEPREANFSRIETLYRLLGDGRVDLRSLHRVWNRRLEHGHSIRDFLAAKEISVPAVEDALQILAPSLEWHSKRGAPKDTPRDGWNIHLLAELPTADSCD